MRELQKRMERGLFITKLRSIRCKSISRKGIYQSTRPVSEWPSYLKHVKYSAPQVGTTLSVSLRIHN